MKIYNYFTKLNENFVYFIVQGRVELLRFVIIREIMLLIHIESGENQADVCYRIVEHIEKLDWLLALLKRTQEALHE